MIAGARRRALVSAGFAVNRSAQSPGAESPNVLRIAILLVPMIDADAFHAFEHDGWQHAAEHYADAFGAVTPQAAGPLLDAVAASSGTRLLDVATGPGFIAAAAAARGAHVVRARFFVGHDRGRGAASSRGRLSGRRCGSVAVRSRAVRRGGDELRPAAPRTAGSGDRRSTPRPAGRAAATRSPCGPAPIRPSVSAWSCELSSSSAGSTSTCPEGPPFFRFSNADECRSALEASRLCRRQRAHDSPDLDADVADGIYEGLSRGGVRTAAILRLQTTEALAAIRSAIRESAERYRAGDQLVLPMPAVLAAGMKP